MEHWTPSIKLHHITEILHPPEPRACAQLMSLPVKGVYKWVRSCVWVCASSQAYVCLSTVLSLARQSLHNTPSESALLSAGVPIDPPVLPGGCWNMWRSWRLFAAPPQNTPRLCWMNVFVSCHGEGSAFKISFSWILIFCLCYIPGLWRIGNKLLNISAIFQYLWEFLLFFKKYHRFTLCYTILQTWFEVRKNTLLWLTLFNMFCKKKHLQDSYITLNVWARWGVCSVTSYPKGQCS